MGVRRTHDGAGWMAVWGPTASSKKDGGFGARREPGLGQSARAGIF